MSLRRFARTTSSKLTTAAGVVRSEGITSLLFILLREYENRVYDVESVFRFLTVLPIIGLSEVLLLFDEGALAYPTRGGDWMLVCVPQLTPVRKMPTLSRVAGTHHGSDSHVDILRNIYSCDGFVEIETDDVVVDVGSYVGAFSMFAAERADTILAIEPGAVVSDALRWNTRDMGNVVVVPKAAWDESTTLKIHQSFAPNENSVFVPDRFTSGRSFQVAADTVPAIVRDAEFDRIDYLKIEAEGAEPEILRGALEDEMSIQKVAVDASPERNQSDTIGEICEILTRHGYECRRETDTLWWGEYIIFARRS